MKKIKLLAVLLALVTMLGVFASCKKNATTPTDETKQNTTTENGTGDSGSGEAKTEQEAYHPVQEDLDYDFRMLLDSGLQSVQQYYTYEEDESSRTVLDDAFYSRNVYLEDYYNIGISVSVLDSENNAQYRLGSGGYLAQQTLANTDFADVIFAVAQNVMNDAIAGGRVLNLRNSESIHFDASYWDQNIQINYAINDCLYTLEGDYSFYDELCTYVTFYSGKLYGEYDYYTKYGDPYDLVLNHKWTLETMLEMIKDTSDVEEGSYATSSNRIGLLTESPITYMLYIGAGKSTITHNEDGTLKLLYTDTAAKQEAEDIFSTVLKKVVDNREVMIIEADTTKGGLNKNFGTAFAMFGNNQTLFYTPTLLTATYIEMNRDTVMGILPIPLYSSEQKTYYSWTSSLSHLPMMIPATAKSNFETIAKIMEALSYFSRYSDNGSKTLYEAQYKWFVDRNLATTAKDRQILEMLFAQRTYDLDCALKITGITDTVTFQYSWNRKTDGLYTALSSLQATAAARLEEFLTDWEENKVD